MRAGYQLRAPVPGHRVHRDPGAHAMPVDVVAGLVLVPRRALPGPALLDQDVIVVEADLRRGHHSSGQGGDPGIPGQLPDLGYLPPPAEAFGESARVIGAAGHLGQRARPGQDRADRPGRSSHLPGAEHPAQAHHAVPGEGRSHAVTSEHRPHYRTVAAAPSHRRHHPEPNTRTRRQMRMDLMPTPSPILGWPSLFRRQKGTGRRPWAQGPGRVALDRESSRDP